MNRTAFDCDWKFAEGDGAAPGALSGYASVFGLLDQGGDIVLPGAFRASLAEWRKRKALPPMLWQHDAHQPIGVWTDLVEDERGLKVAGELVMDVPLAVTTRALLARGAVRGLSIGYRTREAEVDRQTGARRLKRVDLYEISVVTFPMLPEAQVSAVKTVPSDRDLERAFRDEGLSVREAKRGVAVVKKLLLRDGAAPEPTPRDGAADLIMSARRLSASLRA